MATRCVSRPTALRHWLQRRISCRNVFCWTSTCPAPAASKWPASLRELHGHNLVLVAITGWGDEGLRVSNLFADFDHYMRKPVGLAALNKLLPPLG